jgi:hypothetical protein
MIGALSVVTLAAMPYAPELISFQNKTQPLFSAPGESAALLPIKAIPVVFKQPISTHERSFAVGAYPGNRTSSRADVIPAKVTLHKKDRAPKVMMAKASDISAPAETLVLLHSSQFNQPDSVWTLTVWRVSSASGGQQMIQETIVMNSL